MCFCRKAVIMDLREFKRIFTLGEIFVEIIMIVVMVAIFYFLFVRPENKKKKAVDEMRSNLKVGDEITTIGGIVGTICAVKEKTVVMETGADRVRIEFTKWAISSKGTQSSEDAPVTDDSADKKDKKDKKSK